MKVTAILAAAAAVTGMTATAGLERGILVLNQDTDQFQAVFPTDKMTEAGAIEYFDKVNVGANTHFFINVNAAAAQYDSDVWERAYRTNDTRFAFAANPACTNTMVLMERGVDRVKIWSKRAREKGISPWVSMRMNDNHCPNVMNNYFTTGFWLDHPECRRYPGCKSGKWEHMALDYSHEIVRTRALKLVEEMVARWGRDVDGIELDWMRFGRHLAPEIENRGDGAKYLTDFMRKARAIVRTYEKKYGRRILVAARVTTHPEASRRLGMDAVAWAKEDLVDWVISSCFFQTNDYDLKAAEWKAALAEANPKVKFVVGFDKSGVMTDCMGFKLREATRAEMAGFFERMYAEGVRDFYGFNFFVYKDYNPCAKFLQHDGIPSEDALRAEDRAYPITWRDVVPDNWRDPQSMQMPTNLKTRVALRIKIGKVGSPAVCRARLATNKKVPLAAFGDVTLNGVKALSSAETGVEGWLRAKYTFPKKVDAYNIYQATEFAFPVSALRDGYNVFEVGPVEGDVLARSFELYLDAAKK